MCLTPLEIILLMFNIVLLWISIIYLIFKTNTLKAKLELTTKSLSDLLTLLSKTK